MNIVETLYDDGVIKSLYFEGNSDYLIVTFGNLATRVDGAKFVADKLCKKLNISTIGIMPYAAHWYPKESILNFYNENLEIFSKFKKIILYANSMGGYAALKYSKLFKATNIYVISPQVTIDERIVSDPRYSRFYNENIHKDMHVTKNDICGKICIIYDKYCKYDNAHISFIKYNGIIFQEFYCNFCLHEVQLILKGAFFFENLIKHASNHIDNENFIKTINYLKKENFLNNTSDNISSLIKRHPNLFGNIFNKLDINKFNSNNSNYFEILPFILYSLDSINQKGDRYLINCENCKFLKFNGNLIFDTHGNILLFNRIKSKFESISSELFKFQIFSFPITIDNDYGLLTYGIDKDKKLLGGEFKHEVRQFQKPYDNQQAEQISLMV